MKASKIAVAKGKKELHFTPTTENRAEVLKAVMGPSGNLRAPTLKINDRFIVGFNFELYQTTLL